MADGNGTTRPRTQLGKLALKDLGEPAKVKTMDAADLKATGNKYIMGYLIGRARGVIERTDEKKAEVFEGLSGHFRMIPSDPTWEEKESGVLFIPDAFHNMIADKLKAAWKANPDDKNASVEFAFEVASIPAKNPAGYSWSFTPAREFSEVDPLDNLMKDVAKLPAFKPRALAAPARK